MNTTASTPSPAVEIAIRLADEGVPMRAIARATQIPSAILYDRLQDAKFTGQLLALPRDDWPPGCPRDQRSLQLSRLAVSDPTLLTVTIQTIFHLSPQPARLLLLLTQHEVVSREGTSLVTPKCFDVHVCTMRKKLQSYKIKILSLWGYGYQLSQDDRRKVMDLVLAKVAT
jgi:DNA-binding response OmpR family regulator